MEEKDILSMEKLGGCETDLKERIARRERLTLKQKVGGEGH